MDVVLKRSRLEEVHVVGHLFLSFGVEVFRERAFLLRVLDCYAKFLVEADGGSRSDPFESGWQLRDKPFVEFVERAKTFVTSSPHAGKSVKRGAVSLTEPFWLPVSVKRTISTFPRLPLAPATRP
ncbi:hypothetical protein G9U53_26205 [Rhodococcus sp. D-46]|uniref:hypothetical protein n=1 Tax=Rhodococcus sp. D-46 TaxID=2716265 RepID=UPI0013F67D77|nr:hypothetical protein [Rhodococcus sp. D-46]